MSWTPWQSLQEGATIRPILSKRAPVDAVDVLRRRLRDTSSGIPAVSPGLLWHLAQVCGRFSLKTGESGCLTGSMSCVPWQSLQVAAAGRAHRVAHAVDAGGVVLADLLVARSAIDRRQLFGVRHLLDVGMAGGAVLGAMHRPREHIRTDEERATFGTGEAFRPVAGQAGFVGYLVRRGSAVHEERAQNTCCNQPCNLCRSSHYRFVSLSLRSRRANGRQALCQPVAADSKATLSGVSQGGRIFSSTAKTRKGRINNAIPAVGLLIRARQVLQSCAAPCLAGYLQPCRSRFADEPGPIPLSWGGNR